MRTPYTPAEGATQLQKHQDCIKHIYTLTSVKELDAVVTYIDEYELTPTQKDTILNTVIQGQKRLYASKSSETEVDPNVERIQQEYASVDAETFTEEEIKESGINIEVAGGTTTPVQVNATTPDPLDNIPEATKPADKNNVEETTDTPAKRSKKKEAVPTPSTPIKSVTLHRRINLPIENVQYSNNEFGVDVTADTKEEATALLNELMDEFMKDSGLVRKSSTDTLLKAAYERGFGEGKASVPPPTPVAKRTPEDELDLKRYARVQLFMQALASDATILPVMQRIKAEFEKTNPKI